MGTEWIPPKIHTYSGYWVDVTDMATKDVRIEDIAHALSNQCRFSGHTRKFYSVAQHSVLVSKILPEELQLGGLLHDATEAYLQDMARPLKMHPRLGQAYRGLEARIYKVLEEVFGTSLMSPEILYADNIVLVTEARDLMHGTSQWENYQSVEPLQQTILPWTPLRSKTEFMRRYLALTQDRR